MKQSECIDTHVNESRYEGYSFKLGKFEHIYIYMYTKGKKHWRGSYKEDCWRMTSKKADRKEEMTLNTLVFASALELDSLFSYLNL